VVFFAATRHLERRQPPRADISGWLIVLIIFLLCIWYTHIAPDMAARIIFMNGTAAFLAGRIAWNLSLHTLGPRGWFMSDILAAMMWFLAIVLAITGGVTAVSGEPSQDLFQASVPMATLWAVNPALILLIPIVALAVVRNGQKQDSADYLERSQIEMEPGRELFMARCDEQAALAAKAGESFVFALIDLDNFKHTSDRYGFAAADQLLHWVEGHIRDAMEGQEELARFAIDRFAVFLPRTQQATALAMFDTVRHRIETGICNINDVPMKTTVSIGVARMQPGRSTARDLASAAQLAVYRARTVGRNRVDAASDTYTGFDMSRV
jgi:diguanylate cyclase (GGDEF)-like protein